MTLHIETGHPVTANAKKLPDTTIRFVTEDGRTMFEVSASRDGRGVEVRAVDVTKVDGSLYNALIDIIPNASNSITVRVRPYDEP